MPTTPSSRPLWARLAAWLGFVAVFAALLAPVSMLAEDVRTGQLGGLCSATGAGQPGSEDASSANGHCDLCGSTGLALLPLEQTGICHAAAAMAVVFQDALRSTSSPGLPFSRGPPAL
ncbi:MAG: DUF2946 family protein [Polaromonas sp.]|uniref:DUF2946 family protein n=1 Tax=Polaromonas sp. TaxID=1869339 RepID=UPI002734E0B1|nr:DUF2946 family protein [Polaromonas sp.]MDP2817909.1 DUF2946 family protein [Polaromonas sp.]